MLQGVAQVEENLVGFSAVKYYLFYIALGVERLVLEARGHHYGQG
jgi:hypothetical protein